MDDLYQKGRQAMDGVYREGTKTMDKTYNELSGSSVHTSYGFDDDLILGMRPASFAIVAVIISILVIIILISLCCWCCHCCCCAKKEQQVIVYPPNPNFSVVNTPGSQGYVPLQQDSGFVNQLQGVESHGTERHNNTVPNGFSMANL